MTLASIVIPSRGGAKRLPALLSALAAQDDVDWEAIVVLDGDIDGSQSVVARYAHLPVRAITFPENRGRVAALNAGFTAAVGEILIRCDDDLVPRPDYVRRHKAAHARTPGGAIGLYRNVLPATTYARAYGRHADQLFRQHAYEVPPDLRWRYWAGNVSTTRELWNAVGPYDPGYRVYGYEDIDWGYRLHLLGAPISLVPELETDHLVAATTTRIRVLRAFHSGAARQTFVDKHGPDALPSPPPQASPWNTLVDGIARVGDRRLLGVVAGAADGAAHFLPAAVSRKAIAALVEGAELAGRSRAGQTTRDL